MKPENQSNESTDESGVASSDLLAKCESRAIELFYSDTERLDCKQILKDEFGEETVSELLRVGIGNLPLANK